MTDDASLTDFAEDGSEQDEGDPEPTADAANPAASDDVPDTAAPDDAPDPATSTYRWSPGGASCPDCGDAVERRWRDGDRLVCGGCKDW